MRASEIATARVRMESRGIDDLSVSVSRCGGGVGVGAEEGIYMVTLKPSQVRGKAKDLLNTYMYLLDAEKRPM
jgi:hypothetical protein